MKHIMLSVIVPIFNGAEFVEDCCRQLANQTLKDMEIILVNDGSTDGTAAICNRMAEIYSNCIVYHQKNQGVSVARNNGIQLAKGDYLGFVDVDDQYDPDMFELLYKQAVQNDLDVISMDHLGKPNELILLTDKQEILNQFLQSKIQISACYKIFRHTLCPGFSFPEGKQIYEDCMAVYRALKQSKRFGSINVDKYHYIRREGSNSRAARFTMKYLDAIKIIDDICDDILREYPELEIECKRRKAVTYLRISKIFYLRGKPREFQDTIGGLRRWLMELSRQEIKTYYGKNDRMRYYLYLYAFPMFMCLVKTIDRQ